MHMVSLYCLLFTLFCLGCSSPSICQFPQQACESLVNDAEKNRQILTEKMQNYLDQNNGNFENAPLCEIVSEIDDMLDVIDANKNINSKWVKSKLAALRDLFPDRTTKRIFSKYMKVPLDKCLIAENCKIGNKLHGALQCYLCTLSRILSQKCGLVEIECECVN